MGRLQANSGYENVRNARILENQARLASLGLHKTITELRSIASSAKPSKPHVNRSSKKVYAPTSLRRSDRLKTITAAAGSFTDGGNERRRPESEPLVNEQESQGHGSVSYPDCCHICRSKMLCDEEKCKRCSKLDMHKQCIGKTNCSACHSARGVICRGCLKVRYGEELEEVRYNSKWMCPHCIEEKGVNPYWICNSSLCLRERKMEPIERVYRCRKLGYKSVAHFLMDELQKAENCRK